MMRQLTTAIFDVDGLMINSEPLWLKVTIDKLEENGLTFTHQELMHLSGIRNDQFVKHAFDTYNIKKDAQFYKKLSVLITEEVACLLDTSMIMPGVQSLIKNFYKKQFKIGIASAAPVSYIERVMHLLDIAQYISIVESAEYLEHSKPHPQVYLNCAKKMGVLPKNCIAFEDSHAGLLSAKAAGMIAVVVPAPWQYHDSEKWLTADLKLSALTQFDDKLLSQLINANS
ncbi:MAG: hexitol phosphatase HxpB [Phycisphaerales bacterium]|nr:hexitol phosphatase HxpB [Phycisphaerales bacterium]